MMYFLLRRGEGRGGEGREGREREGRGGKGRGGEGKEKEGRGGEGKERVMSPPLFGGSLRLFSLKMYTPVKQEQANLLVSPSHMKVCIPSANQLSQLTGPVPRTPAPSQYHPWLICYHLLGLDWSMFLNLVLQA